MTCRFQLAISAGFMLTITSGQAQVFQDRTVPQVPGERRAMVTVPLNGIPRSRVEVWLHYSDNPSDLANPNTVPRGRASCRTISNGNLRCEFIFPHGDHPTPNILTRTEVNGGEPPSDRPTLIEHQIAVTQFLAGLGPVPATVLTDHNPKRIGSPDTVYYRWVRIVTGPGSSTTNDVERSFRMPRRYIVVNIGDSYAAGEGSPNRDLTDTDNEPMWNDTPCHRSEESGQARGVRAVIQRTPQAAITFANFACSGAISRNLTHETQSIDPTPLDPLNRRTPNGSVQRTPQLDRLETWMADNNRNHVDVMLLSVGGNDAGFGEVALRCLINVTSDCRNDPQVLARISSGLSTLPSRLNAVKNDIESRPFRVHRVLHFGYPDPTRDATGSFCGPSVPASQTCWGPLERTISTADFAFIFNSFLVPLNTALSQFATTTNQNRVDRTPRWTFTETASLSRTRGLCNCSNGFFHTAGQSLSVQGDLLGTAHPNRRGHREAYQVRTEDFLSSQIRSLLRDSILEQVGN
ncbi:MAG: GDSL-type esterase/lipase family protein [Bryobacteraceae bacterium]|nr:GDSL-type esterase/lipase family protein [Bryobacteraceae bacterium]MDW8377549.1 GDSL-type esterase/lipase family protein [Bryobacterales bacterium]